jgi:hypothetical protein
LSVRREFVTAFSSPVVVAADMTLVGAGADGSGYATLNPTSTGAASIRLKGSPYFATGELTFAVDVASNTATCRVRADWSAGSATSSLPTSGVAVLPLASVPENTTLTWLGVECLAGAGSATLDWMTIQNGGYAWAPMGDIEVSFSGMGIPGGGRQTVVRTSEQYSWATSGVNGGLLLKGSDVGGFAWAEAHDPEVDETEWFTANGGWDEWNDAAEFSVSEVFAEWRGDEGSGTAGYRDPGEFDVYALTGTDPTISGNLGGSWYSDDIRVAGLGQSWTLLDDGLVAFKHRDDCSNGNKEIGSGRLIITHPEFENWLVVASAGASTGSASTRGIYLYEKGSGAGSAAEYWTGLPDGGTGYSALPAALAPGGDLDDLKYVLVGYRVRAAGSSNQPALYACPADFDPAITAPGAGSACQPVTDGGVFPKDVRDIEVDPTDPDGNRFFVSDGGRRWTGSSCDGTAEATVYVVEVNVTDLGGGVLFNFEAWDSDTTDADPSWLDGGSPYYAENDDACYRATNSSYGDLVAPDYAPWEEAHDISSIAVDPSGSWLFAFYMQPNNLRRWGCTNVFRAPLDAGIAPGAPLAWEPFQDYGFGAMEWMTTTGHAAQRRAHVDAKSAFMQFEPLLEAWAGSHVHDATFVPVGTSSDLWVGGDFDWWVLADGHAYDSDGVGWDSYGSVSDLDEAAWILGWAGDVGLDAFQDLSASATAVCPGCWAWTYSIVQGWGAIPDYVDAVVSGGTGDYKYANLFANTDGGFQAPANRPCEFHMAGASPVDVESWVDLEGTTEAQLWMIMNPQSAPSAESPVVDIELKRALFFSEGDFYTTTLAQDWCWDGVAQDINPNFPGFAVANYFVDAGMPTQLVCQDSNLLSAHGFPACDGGYGFQLEGAGVGLPRAIEVLGPSTAVLAAVAARPDNGPSAVDPATAGLWVVEHSSSGMAYTPIAFDGSGMGGCSKAEFFQYEYSGSLINRRLAMDVHPSSGWDVGEEVRLFVSSRHPDCGVAEVEFTRGYEEYATWTLLNLDYDGPDSGTAPDCTLLQAGNQYWINGVHAGREGRWLFVYGGQPSYPATYDAVCAIDLATGASGTYTSYTPVMKAADLQTEVRVVTSHPHIADAFFVGSIGSPSCTLCTPPGVFELQRRWGWSASTSTWTERWGFMRIADDDLQHRTVVDLDWGPGEGDRTDPADVLYVTTAGGGWWDGAVTW